MCKNQKENLFYIIEKGEQLGQNLDGIKVVKIDKKPRYIDKIHLFKRKVVLLHKMAQ